VTSPDYSKPTLTATSVVNKPSLPGSWSVGHLLLFALVRGSDYSDGLSQAGPVLAEGLSHYDLGNRLYAAASTLETSQLVAFMRSWRTELLSSLTHDTLGVLPRARSRVVVPDPFPQLSVLRQYVDPLTSWSHGGHEPFQRAHVLSNRPDIEGITLMCAGNFSWTADVILNIFHKKLWGPCLARALINDVIENTVCEAYERSSLVCPPIAMYSESLYAY
jgi:hypothetical protein